MLDEAQGKAGSSFFLFRVAQAPSVYVLQVTVWTTLL